MYELTHRDYLTTIVSQGLDLDKVFNDIVMTKCYTPAILTIYNNHYCIYLYFFYPNYINLFFFPDT